MNCERPTLADDTSSSQAMQPQSMVANTIALTPIWIDRHAYKSVLSSDITESMSFQRISEAKRDPALRYGAVHERRTNWLEGHAATSLTPSPNHASCNSASMAKRQPLDLAAQASARVPNPLSEKSCPQHPILLPAHRFVDRAAPQDITEYCQINGTVPQHADRWRICSQGG